METSPRRSETVAVGLASTFLAGFAAYGLLIIIELFLAKFGTPKFLPPPGDWRMLLAVLVAAVVAGVLITLRWRKKTEHVYSVRGVSAFAAIATAVAVVATLVTHFTLEQSYLDTVPAGIASKSVLLDAGHEACNWIDGRRWGKPPDLPRGNREPPEESAAEAAIYGPGYPTMVVIKSTRRLFVFYGRYLDRQNPGPLTQLDRLRLDVAFVAWYKMCPFQQWVHRPVGGSGD
jgi:hypothetical protein